MAWQWKQWPWSTPQTSSEHWEWPGRSDLKARLGPAELPEQRASLLIDFLCRIEKKRNEASFGASSSHWIQRGTAGLSAAVATLSGGTLLSSLHGRGAVALGITTASIGVVSAAIVAARPDNSYTANQTAKSAYEKLYWDVYSYATIKAKAATDDDFSTQMGTFTTTFETTMEQAPAPSAAAQKKP